MTSRVMERSSLKGRASSRFRSAAELSTQVRLSIRFESAVVRFRSDSDGSGRGVVSARAMLQLFAPRSRTCGKVRFMSCICEMIFHAFLICAGGVQEGVRIAVWRPRL